MSLGPRVKITQTSLALPSHREALKGLAGEWERDQDFWSMAEIWDWCQKNQYMAWTVFYEESQVVGFALVQLNSPSADLLYIYIADHRRGQKIGEVLLRQVHQDLMQNKVQEILLEVRPTNGAAVRLYESFGYQLISRRAKYYRNGDDALIYKFSFATKAH